MHVMIHELPNELMAHICLFLGSYPTHDVGSLVATSKTLRTEFHSSDLIFLALRNHLLIQPRFTGARHNLKQSNSSPHRPRRSSSPQRKSKRLKISGEEILKASIRALRRNSERVHDAVCGIKFAKNQRPKLTIHSFQKILLKWLPCDVNFLHSRGSTLLMEIMKMSTKRSSPSQVAKMSRELLTNWQVDPNKSHPSSLLSPLMIAAARGYTKCVRLLVEESNGQRLNLFASGKGTFFSSVGAVGGQRIRHTGTHTALEWCCEMRAMELNAGANLLQIKDLEECRDVLLAAQQKSASGCCVSHA